MLGKKVCNYQCVKYNSTKYLNATDDSQEINTKVKTGFGPIITFLSIC